MKTVNLYDVKGTEYPAGRLSRVLIGDNGAIQGEQFVQGYSVLYPDGGIPEHEHVPEETYFVIAGTGKITVDGETRTIKKGDIVLVPSGLKHGLHNDSGENMEIMYTYAPKMIVDHWAQELSGELK